MLLFLRPIFYISGLMQLIVAALMLLPLMLELLYGGPDAEGFLEAILIIMGMSLVAISANRGTKLQLNMKQTFLLVAYTWLLTSVSCALPFITTTVNLSIPDAVFEAVSGITTTGGTVIVGLDYLNGGILLWRSLMQWLGGIGIVGISIVLFPFMRIGGMQLFKSESSEKGEKIFAQARVFATSLITIYLTLSIISAALFHLAGLDWFEAINHMMSAVSTGGFSTKDASLGHFQSEAVLWAATFSMLMGALPFTWFMLLGVDWRRALNDQQVHQFFIVTFTICIMMTVWVMNSTDYSGWQALNHATFNVISIITTTGFVSDDFMKWGSFALMLFFICYFIGGCTGSTTGSVKLFRWSIILISLRQQLLRMMMPHRVSRLVYNGKPFNEDVRDAVANFIVLYMLSWLVCALALALTGLDLVTALTGALSALSNVGPGMGDIIGPAGNFSTLNDPAKWILSFTMLLGRLEILGVLLVFMRSFWRD